MESYISFESLVTARESAQWAYVSMIVSIISIIISLLTLIAAWRALSTWRKQERALERKNLIKAFLHYQACLVSAPEKLTPKKPDNWQLHHVNAMHNGITEIRACILIATGKNGYKEYGHAYAKILPIHQSYIYGEVDKSSLISIVNKVIIEDVFHEKPEA